MRIIQTIIIIRFCMRVCIDARQADIIKVELFFMRSDRALNLGAYQASLAYKQGWLVYFKYKAIVV